MSYKDIFLKLFKASKLKNPEDDGNINKVWSMFQEDNFTIEKSFIDQDIFTMEQKNSFKREFPTDGQFGKLMRALEQNIIFDDDKVWREMFFATRNKNCKSLRPGKLKVKVAGREESLGIDELETRMMEDIPDLFNTQVNVPQVPEFSENKEELILKLEQDFEKIQRTYQSEENKKEKLQALKSSTAATLLAKHHADDAEILVQKAIIEIGQKYDIPMVVLRGVKTYEFIGKYLEPLGLKLSKLKSLFGNSEKSHEAEAENDVIAFALTEKGVRIILIEVKTSELECPWTRDHLTTKSPKSKSTANQQVQRSLLRLCELIPDIPIQSNVEILMRLAFPFTEEIPNTKDKDYILTKSEFETESRLLELLGMSSTGRSRHSSEDEKEFYKRIVARYIGAASCIPMKRSVEAVHQTRSNLTYERSLSENSVRSVLEEDNTEDVSGDLDIREIILADKLMKDIKDALKNGRFKAIFKKRHPTIPIDNLKLASERRCKFPFQSKNGDFPIFGWEVLRGCVRALDVDTWHQGAEAVIEMIEDLKMKAVIDGRELDSQSLLGIIKDQLECCDICKGVDALKARGKMENKRIVLTEDHDILQAIELLDDHEGFKSLKNKLTKIFHFDIMDEKVQTLLR